MVQEEVEVSHVLDSVLRLVDVRGVVFLRSEFSAPWGLSIEAKGRTFFHLLLNGQCWIEVDGSGTPVRLESGDLAILPHGTLHRLRDDPTSPAPALEQVLAQCGMDGRKSLRCGGGGEPTTMVCGEFCFADRVTDPLLYALPPHVKVEGTDGKAAPWLQATIEWVANEMDHNLPGAEHVVQRLTDIMFIQSVRVAFQGKLAEHMGWMRGLKDPQIARVLSLIHRLPHESWTVQSLADRAGMSRSALATRFTNLVGEPPLHYLTRWRINKAAFMLRTMDTTTNEVGATVGFLSDVGFTRAFKRFVGVAPGQYRKSSKAR